jgi:hypothetical protein
MKAIKKVSSGVAFASWLYFSLTRSYINVEGPLGAGTTVSFFLLSRVYVRGQS